MTASPQLRALGGEWRILAAFVDAFITGCVYVDEAWDSPLVRTQIIIESGKQTGWNEDLTARQMRLWGARDQHGIYAAAGLTKAETEVAFMFFDRQLEPAEIAGYLRRPAVTVRVQLHRAHERLRGLSRAA